MTNFLTLSRTLSNRFVAIYGQKLLVIDKVTEILAKTFPSQNNGSPVTCETK